MAKQKKGQSGIVYSTDPDFNLEEEKAPAFSPEPAEQKLRVTLETKQRAGKPMTVVTGFQGPDETLETLARKLKIHCGTGGSAKDGEILIQGDQRQKVLQWLHAQGYVRSK